MTDESSSETVRDARGLTSKVEIGDLPKPVRKAATQNIAPDEQIDFAFWGVANQTLVGLRDRILVLQPGIASGAAFGCNAATLYYRDIVGVQAQTTMLKGSLEISTAGARASIACTRGRLKRWQPYLDELRTRMASAKA